MANGRRRNGRSPKFTRTIVPEIKLDGRRQFYGRPQLTDCEIELFEKIKRFDQLQLVFTRQGPEYRYNGKKVDRRAARRLIDHHYLVCDSPGLFAEDGPAQTWCVRPDTPDLRRRAPTRKD